jgi:hypothetical protein
MLLIYAHIISPRLQYIASFLFVDLHSTPFRLTDNPAALAQHQGPAICYHPTNLSPSAFHIVPVDLLFETDIRPQTIDCFTANEQKAFFRTTGGDWPFDIFAAAFYLISRYEEYLPHEKDSYGRYAHTNSLAFKAGFLHLPLVEIWGQQLREALQQRFADILFEQRTFSFLPTYDIDIAWSYRHKGWWRNLGGALRNPGSIGQRLTVLLGKQSDPFDSYDWLHRLHQAHGLQPLYFFLVAAQNGRYDKNILPHQPALRQLIQYHAGRYSIGLHPSWQSGDNPTLLTSEKQILENRSGKSVCRSRQHYIRFNLPMGYHQLIQAGITEDYSMGYGSINGFRASVAQPFNWFDVATNESTPLRVHPFCLMDANSFYEQQLSPQQALEELQRYAAICKELNTVLCTIWHNNFLGTDPLYKGWRAVYASFMQSL